MKKKSFRREYRKKKISQIDLTPALGLGGYLESPEALEELSEKMKEPKIEPIPEIEPAVEKKQIPPPTLPPTPGSGRRQDISMAAFQHLKSLGYTTCIWHLNENHQYHEWDPCFILDKPMFNTYTIDEIISGVRKTVRKKNRKENYEGLQHNAPIFERSHPGCQCYLECTGPGLNIVNVGSNTFL